MAFAGRTAWMRVEAVLDGQRLLQAREGGHRPYRGVPDAVGLFTAASKAQAAADWLLAVSSALPAT